MTYHPTLSSVNTHPVPDWYKDAKLGIFIHWGLYSIPSYAPSGEMAAEKLLKGEMSFGDSPYAEWYQNSLRIQGSSVQAHHMKTYGVNFPYEQFAPQFNEKLSNWNPNEWADLFSRAGARYVVLVTKHHDGFLMWNSHHPNPRIPNWQAGRDIPGELSQAISARGMKLGLYYSSLLDWSFSKTPINSLAELIAGSDTSKEYLVYVENHWRELIERYDPWILWSDIGYPPGYALPRLFAEFYNHKPEGAVNDRWMQLPKFFFNPLGRAILTQMIKKQPQGEMPKVPHCDFVTPEYATLDHIAPHKWETCRGIGNSFGYNQMENTSDYQKAEDLIRLLADIVSKNGNLLLNVGPCADGSIHPAQIAALNGLGAWLNVNGEAIYGTTPWTRFMDGGNQGAEVRYTSKTEALYAIVIKMPADSTLSLPIDVGKKFTLLETGNELPVEYLEGKIQISLPPGLAATTIPVIKIQGEPISEI